MNYAKRVADKHTLWGKIKRLAALWCENEVFTQQYAKDVYNACMQDLGGAIACFTSLVDQAQLLGRKIHDDTEVKDGGRI